MSSQSVTICVSCSGGFGSFMAISPRRCYVGVLAVLTGLPAGLWVHRPEACPCSEQEDYSTLPAPDGGGQLSRASGTKRRAGDGFSHPRPIVGHISPSR